MLMGLQQEIMTFFGLKACDLYKDAELIHERFSVAKKNLFRSFQP